MTMRAVRSAGWAVRTVCALALAYGLATGPSGAETVTLPQMQAAAVAAVEAGDDAAAAAIARQILTVNPADALAEFVLTVVEMRAGRLPEARAHGRRAYRLADSRKQKFQAAMIAADIADREDRPLALRFWLRQAADQAPGDKWRQSVLGILAEEKAKSPVALHLSFSLAPSSNVNNGSSSPYSVIDGLPIVGEISAEGRALSGWEGSVRLGLEWKLAETDRTRTEFLSTATIYRVALSGAAKAAAPGLSGSDLGDTVLSFGLRHSWLAADGRAKTVAMIEAGLGESGTGARRDLLTLGLSQMRDLGEGRALIWDLELARTDPETANRSETERRSVTLGYGTPLGNGDRLYGEASLAATAAGPGSDRALRESRTAMLRLVWSKAKPVGPFSLSVSAGLSMAEYPDFRIGFLTVPGGRQDKAAFAEVSLGLDQMSFAGFQPVISLRGLKTDSNVSVYSTEDLSVGLGLAAEF